MSKIDAPVFHRLPLTQVLIIIVFMLLLFCLHDTSTQIHPTLLLLFCLCSCMRRERDGKNWNHRAVTQVGCTLIPM